MSSDRPKTPPRSLWGESKTPSISTSSREKARTHVASEADFPLASIIYPLREALFSQETGVPSLYLQQEAVDAALRLGEGASFAASLQFVPPGPEREEFTTKMPTFTVTTSRPVKVKSPVCVVYKVARVAIDEKGHPLPEHRRAMRSILTEINALTNPVLRKHANIIDFLGVAFATSPFSHLQKLPAIVTEYANHGTLTMLLRLIKPFDYQTKQQLALDVRRGLSVLHEEGLVHGDVKPDNVLICSHPVRKYIAKIADFGFSIFTTFEEEKIIIGGTQPWSAPEIKHEIQMDMLPFTDIFSYGLLIWTIGVGGRNPFELVFQDDLSPPKIDEAKLNGDLVRRGQQIGWFLSYLLQELSKQNPSMASMYSAQLIGSAGEAINLSDISYSFSQVRMAAAENQTSPLTTFSTLLQHSVLRNIDEILMLTIQPDPKSRKLGPVIDILEARQNSVGKTATEQQSPRAPSETSDEGIRVVRRVTAESNSQAQILATPFTNGSTLPSESLAVDAKGSQPVKLTSATETSTSSPPKKRSWANRVLGHNWYSWQKTRDMEPLYQNMVFDHLNSKYGPLLFFRSSLLMNGYGCEPDAAAAVETLKQAAENGSTTARAYLHRIWLACQQVHRCTFNEANTGSKYLYEYGLRGSRPALMEYRALESKEKSAYLERMLSDAAGGVGAPWLNQSEMLNGHTQSQWIKDDWLMERVRSAKIPLLQMIVNRRGDTVLHFVAMCGRVKPFRALIEEYSMDINLRNAVGETPLLSAMRSGHGAIVILCLQRYGADASIAAQNGESPMHWLIRHEDQYVPLIIKDLLLRGAHVDARSTEPVQHGEFQAGIDIEILSPGTPLLWAAAENRPGIVRALLGNGADPEISETATKGFGNFSALKRSAYYHHYECLQIMIEHLESKVTERDSEGNVEKRHAISFGPLVRQCVHAADTFSMMLRGGADYLNRLHRTLDLLREKTKLINFEAHFGGTFLFYVVSEAHDEVAEYMFQHQWHTETLNICYDQTHGRTAVLEAVRWNRQSMLHILMRNGGDLSKLATNPFRSSVQNWSALHIFAQEGHTKNLDIVEKLADAGPIDGSLTAPETFPVPQTSEDALSLSTLTLSEGQQNIKQSVYPCETPLSVALRHNAFKLCSKFLALGADPNALCLSAGLFASPYPLTILGHIIISNARYSAARLQYIMSQSNTAVNFVVEPTRQLTALHRAAMGYQDTIRMTDNMEPKAVFDADNNADILYELLLKWKSPDQLNAKCAIDGNTALHLAVRSENTGAVEQLVNTGADRTVKNDNGVTALELAHQMDNSSKMELILKYLS